MLIAAVAPRTGACGEKILVHVASVSTTTTSDLTKLDLNTHRIHVWYILTTAFGKECF